MATTRSRMGRLCLGAARGAVSIGLLACGPQLAAQNARSVVDGAVTLVYPETHYSSDPSVDLLGTAPVASADPLYASGWWYRIVGVDAREYPLPAPDSLDDGADGVLNAYWGNLSGTDLVLTERVRPVDREGPSGGYVSEIFATNLGSTDVHVMLFHYLDPDLAGTSAGDSVARLNPAYLIFSEGTERVRYRSFAATTSFAAAAYPTIWSLLNDADADTLGDTLVVTPGDLNAAYQFDTTIPGGTTVARVAGVSVTSGPGLDYVKGDGLLGLYPQVQSEHPVQHNRELWRMRRGARVDVEGYLPPGTRALLGTDDFSGSKRDSDVEFDSGNGRFFVGGEPANPQPAAGWKVAATGDLNADGKADILWRNPTTQKLEVWTMDGKNRTGVITPSPDQAVNANWEVVGLADFDNNGALDFLWYNQTSRKIVIWYMNPQVQRITGGFTNPSEVANGNWKALATADWGRGGGPYRAPDILWQNDTSGKLVLWNMDFAGNRTSGTFLSPDAPLDGFKLVGPR